MINFLRNKDSYLPWLSYPGLFKSIYFETTSANSIHLVNKNSRSHIRNLDVPVVQRRLQIR